MGFFYQKKEISEDTGVSPFFPDFYLGKNDFVQIGGEAGGGGYIFKAPRADRLSYGEGKLVGASLNLYPSTVTKSEPNGPPLSFKIYKMAPISTSGFNLTEGIVSVSGYRGPNTIMSSDFVDFDTSLVALAVSTTDTPHMIDTFDGLDKFISSNRTTLTSMQARGNQVGILYHLKSQIVANQKAYWGTTKHDIDTYCTPASEHQIPGIGEPIIEYKVTTGVNAVGNLLSQIFVEDTDNSYNPTITTKERTWGQDPFLTQAGKDALFGQGGTYNTLFGYDLSQGNNPDLFSASFVGRGVAGDALSESVSIKYRPAETTNTLFHDIDHSPNRDIVSEGATGDTLATIGFNGEALTGSSALRLSTIWQSVRDSSGKLKTQTIGSQKYTIGEYVFGDSAGLTMRQYSKAVMHLPAPVTLAPLTGGSANADENSQVCRVELDVKMKLARAFFNKFANDTKVSNFHATGTGDAYTTSSGNNLFISQKYILMDGTDGSGGNDANNTFVVTGGNTITLGSGRLAPYDTINLDLIFQAGDIVGICGVAHGTPHPYNDGHTGGTTQVGAMSSGNGGTLHGPDLTMANNSPVTVKTVAADEIVVNGTPLTNGTYSGTIYGPATYFHRNSNTFADFDTHQTTHALVDLYKAQSSQAADNGFSFQTPGADHQQLHAHGFTVVAFTDHNGTAGLTKNGLRVQIRTQGALGSNYEHTDTTVTMMESPSNSGVVAHNQTYKTVIGGGDCDGYLDDQSIATWDSRSLSCERGFFITFTETEPNNNESFSTFIENELNNTKNCFGVGFVNMSAAKANSTTTGDPTLSGMNFDGEAEYMVSTLANSGGKPNWNNVQTGWTSQYKKHVDPIVLTNFKDLMGSSTTPAFAKQYYARDSGYRESTTLINKLTTYSCPAEEYITLSICFDENSDNAVLFIRDVEEKRSNKMKPSSNAGLPLYNLKSATANFREGKNFPSYMSLWLNNTYMSSQPTTAQLSSPEISMEYINSGTAIDTDAISTVDIDSIKLIGFESTISDGTINKDNIASRTPLRWESPSIFLNEYSADGTTGSFIFTESMNDDDRYGAAATGNYLLLGTNTAPGSTNPLSSNDNIQWLYFNDFANLKETAVSAATISSAGYTSDGSGTIAQPKLGRQLEKNSIYPTGASRTTDGLSVGNYTTDAASAAQVSFNNIFPIELCRNGGFGVGTTDGTSTGWIAASGWTLSGSGSSTPITSGTATHSSGTGALSTTIGPLYSDSEFLSISFTITDRSAGSVQVRTKPSEQTGGTDGTVRSANGTFSEAGLPIYNMYANDDDEYYSCRIYFVPSNDFDGKISNVSVKCTTHDYSINEFKNSGLVRLKWNDGDTVNSHTRSDWAAREHILASTRVLKIVSDSQLVVSDVNRLKRYIQSNATQTFRLYAYGEAPGGTTFKDITISSINEETGVVTTTTFSDVFDTDTNTSKLLISPKMYWLTLGGNFSSRSYGSVVALDDDSNKTSLDHWGSAPLVKLGTTWNSYLHKPLDASETWSLEPSFGNEYIITDTDYGFGVIEEDSRDNIKEGGIVTKTATYQAEKTLSFNMDKWIEKDKPNHERDDIFLLVPTDELNGGILKFHSSDTMDHNYGSADPIVAPKFKPFMRYKYEDELVESIEDLTIIPDEQTGILPKFTWSSSESDVWYGFLMFKDRVPEHQYDGVVMHIPLNDNTLRTTNIKMYKYDVPQDGSTNIKYASYGNFVNVEGGLEDYSYKFDDSQFIQFADALYTQPTTNFSLSAHIIVDDAPAGDEYIIKKSGEFSLYINSSQQIVATVTPNSGDAITLTSGTQILCDGVTPYNIILTLDNSINSGNLKLFIDGNLEDQTGLRTTAGSSNNWKTSSTLANSTSILNVGCNTVANRAKNYNFNGAGPYVNGGSQGTTVNLVIDGCSEQPVEGDTVTIAGVSGTYTVSSATTLTGGGTTLTFTTNKASQPADNAVVTFGSTTVNDGFDGVIEELVLYNETIYPIKKGQQELELNKPFEELKNSTEGHSKPYSARIFLKDYHNIRGKNLSDISQSNVASLRKSAFLLDGT